MQLDVVAAGDRARASARPSARRSGRRSQNAHRSRAAPDAAAGSYAAAPGFRLSHLVPATAVAHAQLARSAVGKPVQTGLQRVGAEFGSVASASGSAIVAGGATIGPRFARHRPTACRQFQRGQSRSPACPTAGAPDIDLVHVGSHSVRGRRSGPRTARGIASLVPAQRQPAPVGEYSRQRQVVQSASLKRVHLHQTDGVECTMRMRC